MHFWGNMMIRSIERLYKTPKTETARLYFSLILLALFLNFQAQPCFQKGRFYMLALPTSETVPAASNF
jgi:hypothetical protein